MTQAEFTRRLQLALAQQYPHGLGYLGDLSDLMGSVWDGISSAASAVGSGISSAASSLGSGFMSVLQSPATSDLIKAGATVYVASQQQQRPVAVPVTQANQAAVAATVQQRATQISNSLASTGVDISSPAMRQLINDVAATGLTSNSGATVYPPLIRPASSSDLSQYLPYAAGAAALGLLLMALRR